MTKRFETSLKIFACLKEDDAERFFRFLRRFASTNDQPRKQAEAAHEGVAASNMRSADTPDDYPAHVHAAFHAVVKEYLQCACAAEGASLSKNHEARLKLRETIKMNDEDVFFDTVFSRTPTGREGPVEWQHLQFQVLKYGATLSARSFVAER